MTRRTKAEKTKGRPAIHGRELAVILARRGRTQVGQVELVAEIRSLMQKELVAEVRTLLADTERCSPKIGQM